MESKLLTDPEYLGWRLLLKDAAIQRGYIISVEHEDSIMGIYCLKGDEDVEKCLDRYESFCVRWKALHEPGGDFHVPGLVYNLPAEAKVEYLVQNQTVVSAGGLDIKVMGNTITFTISNKNWEMSVAELESMLESHQLLKDAVKQLLDADTAKDMSEYNNGITSAIEALRRAD